MLLNYQLQQSATGSGPLDEMIQFHVNAEHALLAVLDRMEVIGSPETATLARTMSWFISNHQDPTVKKYGEWTQMEEKMKAQCRADLGLPARDEARP